MVSEWEEMESWSKEDLIIELVHMRHFYGILREGMGDRSPHPYMERKHSGDFDDYVEGEPTTDEWAERIALHGAMHPKDGWFYSVDLMDYGLTEDQVEKVCGRFYTKGLLKMPEGIRSYEFEGNRCQSPVSIHSRGIMKDPLIPIMHLEINDYMRLI